MIEVLATSLNKPFKYPKWPWYMSAPRIGRCAHCERPYIRAGYDPFLGCYSSVYISKYFVPDCVCENPAAIFMEIFNCGDGTYRFLVKS